MRKHAANGLVEAPEGKYRGWKIYFCVLCCRWNLKFGIFMLSFGRQHQRIALNWVPQVQHHYFSSFNQSDHCFLALSLLVQSSLLKLPIISMREHFNMVIIISICFCVLFLKISIEKLWIKCPMYSVIQTIQGNMKRRKWCWPQSGWLLK